nr:hypothetical protein [Myxococcus xanthus]
MACAFLALALGCSGSATVSGTRRDIDHSNAYALASCSDSVSCCIMRNPGVPEACGLTASEAAVYIGALDAAMNPTSTMAQGDDADDGWREHCLNTYVLCRDQKKPTWDGDCYACFRYCEGQRQWPYEDCSRRKR